MKRKFPVDITTIDTEVSVSEPDIDYSELDSDCVEIVKFFNSHGLPTQMCCQGHNDTLQSLFWVSFDESVKATDIIKFQSRYLDPLGSFVSCGNFGTKLFLCSKFVDATHRDGVVYGKWEYVAASATAAMEDLKTWQAMDLTSADRKSPDYYWDSN